MADGPCTVISDYGGIVQLAQQGTTAEWCKPVWQDLYAAMQGKDVVFERKRRHDTLGQRLAQAAGRGSLPLAETAMPTRHLVDKGEREYTHDVAIGGSQFSSYSGKVFFVYLRSFVRSEDCHQAIKDLAYEKPGGPQTSCNPVIRASVPVMV